MPTIAEQLLGSSLQAVQNQDSGIVSGLQSGVKLAQQVQQIQQSREQLELKKDYALAAKYNSAMNSVQTLGKIPPKARKAYIKDFLKPRLEQFGFNASDAFFNGLQDDSFDVGKALESVNEYGLEFKNSLQTGQPLSDRAKELMGIMQPWMETGQMPTQWLREEQQQQVKLRSQELAGQARERRLEGTQQRFETRETRRGQERFTDFTKSLASEVRTKFTPIEKSKVAIRNGHSSLQKIVTDIQGGKKPSSIDFNVAARGLAKAFNSGAMSDVDVADFKNLTGIQEITEDKINKWVTGNVNTTAVGSLLGIAQRSGANLDQQAQTLAQSFRPQFQTPEFNGREKEIERVVKLDTFTTPTIPTPSAPQITDDQIAQAIQSDRAKGIKDSEIRAKLSKFGIKGDRIGKLLKGGS